MVKYDHTPLHRSVADLAAHFVPPPRVLGPGAQKLQQQKTPKPSKTDRMRETKRNKSRESTTKAQDEIANNPRKRKKKNNGDAQAAIEKPPDRHMIPPNCPGVPVDDKQSGPSYRIDGQTDAPGDENQQGFNGCPQGLVGVGPSNAANGTSAQPNNQSSAVVPLSVKVSAVEATRRREAAISLLSQVGVVPDSLSVDQFSIFSNQSPELQKESLAMLVKYGAERLQIIHPSNIKEGSASAQSNTPTGSNQNSSRASPTGPRTTKQLVPQADSISQIPDEDDTDIVVASANAEKPAGTPGKRRNMGKSQSSCFPCKTRRTKVSCI